MTGIFGSGFGIYGHLPAILSEYDSSIGLPKAYKEKFDSREEISVFEKKIVWFETEEELFKNVETLVISKWPLDQPTILSNTLNFKNIKHVVLEKPIAASPISAITLLDKLDFNSLHLRINYIFLYTGWYTNLVSIFKKDDFSEIRIDWKFKAHHYRNNIYNWKRSHKIGGGAIRFYGIHLIAILAKLKIIDVVNSYSFGRNPDDIEKWHLEVKNTRVKVIVDLDSNADNEFFEITKNSPDLLNPKQVIFRSDNPFGSNTNQVNEEDYRVPLLIKLYQSLLNKSEDKVATMFYKETNMLWSNVEHLTQHLNII